MEEINENDKYQAVSEKDIIEVSRGMDRDREEVEGLPYPSAFYHLVGDEDEDALWIKIDRMQATKGELKEARNIIQKYRFKNVKELKELRDKQRLYGEIFSVDVRFDKYEAGFAHDLINKIKEGRLISYKQFKWIQNFVYRYRDQLKDQIIYEENGSDDLYDSFDTDPRIWLEEIISESKPAYKELNTRYDED